MIKYNLITFYLHSSSKTDIAIEYSEMENLQNKVARQFMSRYFHGLNPEQMKRYKLIVDIDDAASPATVSYDFNINKDDLYYQQLIEKAAAIDDIFESFNDNCAILSTFKEAKYLYIKQLDSTDNPDYLAVKSLLERDVLTHIKTDLPSKSYGLSFSLFKSNKKYSCPRLFKQPKEYKSKDSWYGRISLCTFDNHIQFISQQEYKKRWGNSKSKNKTLIDNNKHYKPCKYRLISITANQRKKLEEIFENDPSAIYSNFHLNVEFFTRYAFGIVQSTSNTQLMSFKSSDDQFDF